MEVITAPQSGEKEKEEKKEKEKEKSPTPSTSGGSPNVWKAPPKIVINIDDLVQEAKSIRDLVREHGILYNLDQARADYLKRVVSIFVVDKRTRRVIRPTKIVVLKELTSLGIRVQQIIAGNSYAMWRVLLPSLRMQSP